MRADRAFPAARRRSDFADVHALGQQHGPGSPSPSAREPPQPRPDRCGYGLPGRRPARAPRPARGGSPSPARPTGLTCSTSGGRAAERFITLSRRHPEPQTAAAPASADQVGIVLRPAGAQETDRRTDRHRPAAYPGRGRSPPRCAAPVQLDDAGSRCVSSSCAKDAHEHFPCAPFHGLPLPDRGIAAGIRVPGCSDCPAPETRCGRNGTPPDLSPNSRGTALAMSSIAGPLRSANWTSACLRLLLNCLERSSEMGVILPANWPSRGPRHADADKVEGAAAGIADVPFACPHGRTAP